MCPFHQKGDRQPGPVFRKTTFGELKPEHDNQVAAPAASGPHSPGLRPRSVSGKSGGSGRKRVQRLRPRGFSPTAVPGAADSSKDTLVSDEGCPLPLFILLGALLPSV